MDRRPAEFGRAQEGRTLRQVPKGIVLLAMAGFLLGAIFVLVGSLYAVAPAMLQSYGFGADPTVSVRLMGVGFFGGVGVLCGVLGYGLLRLNRYALMAVVSMAFVNLVRRGSRLFGDDVVPNAPLNVAVVALCIVVLCYLFRPTLRAFGVREDGADQGREGL